jgi:hypothetical protein
VKILEVRTWVKEGVTKGYFVKLEGIADEHYVGGQDGAPLAGLEGQELPAGWVIGKTDRGPNLTPPGGGSKKGAPAAYRNTKDGFLAEQLEWRRKNAIEQRSIHASVALEHAVVYSLPQELSTEQVLERANEFFEWLREKAGTPPDDVVASAASDRDGGATATSGWGETVVPLTPDLVGDMKSARAAASDAGGEGGHAEGASAGSSTSEAAPHEHKPGRVLASGKALCVECGKHESEWAS